MKVHFERPTEWAAMLMMKYWRPPCSIGYYFNASHKSDGKNFRMKNRKTIFLIQKKANLSLTQVVYYLLLKFV